MKSIRKPIEIVAAAILFLGAEAGAQGNSLKDQLAEFSTDLSMPASPAAAHVGLSSESVVLPRNRRAFETGLSNIFKGSGKPTGVLEFAPYYIARGGKLRFTQYRDDGTFRALTKTTIGVAVGTRKIDNAEITASGLSLSTVLIDLSDPIYSFGLQRCINDVQKGMLERAKEARGGEAQQLPNGSAPRQFDDGDEVKDDKAVSEYKACIAKRESELWNRSKLSAGIAGGRGTESAAPNRSLEFGTGVWVTAQYGFEDWETLRRLMGSGPRYYDCDQVTSNGVCQSPHEPSRFEQRAVLSLHARRTNGASDLDLSKTGDLPKVNSTLIGARFTYGSQGRSVFLETSRSSLKGQSIDKRTEQQAFGASFRVMENLWFNAVSARRQLYSGGKLEDVVELNLQYGASSEPLVKQR